MASRLLSTIGARSVSSIAATSSLRSATTTTSSLFSSRTINASTLPSNTSSLSSSSITSLASLRPNLFTPAARSFSVATVDKNMLQLIKREVEDEQPDAKPQKPAGFDVQDIPGQTRVTLTKTLSNQEKLVVEFEILPPKSELDEDMPEENENEENPPEEEEDLSNDQFEFRVHLVKGSNAPILTLMCLTTGSGENPYTIKYANWSNDAQTAMGNSAEAEWKRMNVYMGPTLDQLPEDIFYQLYDLLDARGIDEEFCNFIVEYSMYKEQNEYIAWLGNFRKFLESK